MSTDPLPLIPGVYRLPNRAELVISPDGDVVLGRGRSSVPLARKGGAVFGTDLFVGERGTPQRRKVQANAAVMPDGCIEVFGTYFGSATRQPAELAARTRFVGTPRLPPSGEPANKAFIGWAREQLTGVPAVGNTYTQLVRMLQTANAPRSVAELVGAALRVAWRNVGGDTSIPTRSERTKSPLWAESVAVAFVALGALALLEESKLLPSYLPDGRTGTWGNDKTRHALSQGMFAAVSLYDRRYGTGELSKAFDAVVEAMDPDGRASLVDAAYERVRGAPGPLIGRDILRPESGPFVPHPQNLAPDANDAYRQAVRLGCAYEHQTTLPKRRSYDLEELGSAAAPANGQVPDEDLRTFRGLSDAAVCYDLTANRVGAHLAVALLEGDTGLAVPFDGARTPSAPFPQIREPQ